MLGSPRANVWSAAWPVGRRGMGSFDPAWRANGSPRTPQQFRFTLFMVNRNLIREFDVSEEDWNVAIGDALPEDMDWLERRRRRPQSNRRRHACSASTTTSSWSTSATRAKASSPATNGKKATSRPQIGQTRSASSIEDVEDVHGRIEESRGMIVLSKRKAEKIEEWLKVMETVHEGDVVTGTVTRKIKGGLLVDIGVNVFLPASQVDIRRPPDIGDYIGQHDRVHGAQDRRSPPQHRRQPPHADRRPSGPRRRPQLLKQLEVGQLRKGMVKNIADFGAFVDLGGIDGLLHITDMSWGRINHPSRDGARSTRRSK